MGLDFTSQHSRSRTQPEDTSIARRLRKHLPAATNKQAIVEELLETVFYFGSAPRLYNEEPRPAALMSEVVRRTQCLGV
jgi:hypothetical protein